LGKTPDTGADTGAFEKLPMTEPSNKMWRKRSARCLELCYVFMHKMKGTSWYFNIHSSWLEWVMSHNWS
jgi:hypothetical protein